MKAIVTTAYGSPDVLQLQDVPKPTPKDNQVLIKVHASVVGPADVAFRQGKPFIVKLLYGLRKPKFAIFGAEVAGIVEAVGKDVTEFKIGDRVFGLSADTFGAHAEYMCLKEDAPLTTLSPEMTFEDAVGIADGGLTALTFLRDVAKVQPGQKVLINGASGAVGGYAVQLARHFGTEVTGVCSGRNVDLVTSLGADHVIDYTKDDFTTTGPYDVIFDAVGKSSFGKAKRALTPNGVYMGTVPTLGIVLAVLRTAITGGKKAKFATAGLMAKKADVVYLRERWDAGQIKAFIDRRYPLEDIADAYRYVETGRKRGNVVVWPQQHQSV